MEVPGVTHEDLLHPGTPSETLDRTLALALQNILPKDLEMHVNTEKAQPLEKPGKRTIGRKVLWHIDRHFQTSQEQTKIYGVLGIAQIEWFGDTYKATRFAFWNDRWLRLPDAPGIG